MLLWEGFSLNSVSLHFAGVTKRHSGFSHSYPTLRRAWIMSETRKQDSPAFIPPGHAGLLPWPSPGERFSLATGGGSATSLVLERELHLHPVGQRPPRLNVDVLLDNAGDPQVPQGLGSPLDGGCGRLFPRLVTGSHQLDHLVHTFWHVALLSFRWLQ